MSKQCTWSLVLGGLLVITPALCLGQTGGRNRGEEGSTPAAGQEGAPGAQRNPWDDPQVRLQGLRMGFITQMMNTIRGEGNNDQGGGRGGRGGFMMGGGGPGGGSITNMVMTNSALQEELKLTEEQKQRLREVSEEGRNQMRQMFDSMRNNRGGDEGGRGGFDREQMGQMFAQMRQQSEQALTQVLTPAQQKRLKQIHLQILGPFGVLMPEAAKAINLSPAQYQTTQQIVDEMQQAQRDAMMKQGERMRQQFNFPGGPGGQGGPGGPGFRGAPDQQGPGQGQGPGQAPGAGGATGRRRAGGEEVVQGQDQGRRGRQGGEAAPAAPPNDGDENQAPVNTDRGAQFRRVFQSPEFQAEMKKTQEESQKIVKLAEQRIAKTLTARQKQNYNKLLGEEFEVAKLVEGNMFGGRGGPGGQRNPGQGQGPGAEGRTPGNDTGNAARGGRNAGGRNASGEDDGE